MLKAILFDLDGTLLPMDTDRFVYNYMKALAAHVGPKVPPERLVAQVMASTQVMVANTDPALTNAQVFAQDFFPKVGHDPAELMPVFDQFYRERFPDLKSTCTGLPGLARAVVETAVAKGYEVVLATNPVFPRVAIAERMRWVGIQDLPWSLVTTYEEMHACKPHAAYYREVLARIGRTADECLMVGNDVEEDLSAANLGMDVYLVTDFALNRNGIQLPVDRTGSLTNLLQRLATGI